MQGWDRLTQYFSTSHMNQGFGAEVLLGSFAMLTLVRRVARLGMGHRFIEIQSIDMFPQTAHAETVVLMSRVEK